MKIGKSKYRGWHLEAISLDSDLFTVDLVRHHATLSSRAGLPSQHERAKIVFNSVRKIVLSKISNGAEIADIEQKRDGGGNILCILKSSEDSSIEVTSEGLTDFVF